MTVLNQPRPSNERICSKLTTGLAWIEPNGKVHWLDRKNTHGQWAYFYMRPERDDGTWAPVEDWNSYNRLLENGWMRVSNILHLSVWDIDSVPTPIWDAWAGILASCRGSTEINIEDSSVGISWGSMWRGPGEKFEEMSPADVVERFCSRKGKDVFWSSMMGESLVRRIVRMALLEDLKGFQARTSGIDYMANLDDPTFEDPRQGSLVNKPLAINVKRAWAAEADHKFMDSIIKIHWTGGLDWEKKLRNFLKLSRKNEISTSGYLLGSSKFSSSWGTIGVIVKGRTTLASNDMNTVSSGYHGQVEPETLKKYASSGVPKRPLSFRGPSAWGGGSSKYILDRDSFDPYESRRSEFIIDNWKPVGIIVDIIDFLGTVQFPSVSAEPNIRYAEVVLELGLPVYDWEMKEIPREKIEAALRGAGGRL